MANATPTEMVEFEGVRYQPSDLEALKKSRKATEPETKPAETKEASAPLNKARTTAASKTTE